MGSSCEDRATTVNQATPRMTSSHQKLGEKNAMGSPLENAKELILSTPLFQISGFQTHEGINLYHLELPS